MKGAEATISIKKDTVVKLREPKTYRLPQIDEKFIKLRTRSEAKVLETAKKANIPVPSVISVDEKKGELILERIHGKKLRDVLTKKNAQAYAKELTTILLSLHKHNIIHGDLTTSNIIVADKLYLIDFGLSYISTRVEDRAVDLHLLKEAVESYHHNVDFFTYVLEHYKDQDVLTRLRTVEKRGKNKH